jgi:hypothetical protein
VQHGGAGCTRDCAGDESRFQSRQAPATGISGRGKPGQCTQAAYCHLQLLRQNLTARFQIIHQTVAQRRPATLWLGDHGLLIGRPLGQPIDDQPHQARLQPWQVELRHVRMKAQALEPLSSIFAAGDDDGHAVVLKALTQHAPERVFTDDSVGIPPDAGIGRQKALAVTRLCLVVVELVEQQQRPALGAQIIVAKGFRILTRGGAAIELAARRVITSSA